MQNAEVPPVGDESAEDSLDPTEPFWRDLELADGDEFAIRALWAAGFPIYYEEDDTPAGLLIKEYPDGRRELVRFRRGGDEVICGVSTPFGPAAFVTVSMTARG